jgi:molecular chaperone GrpE
MTESEAKAIDQAMARAGSEEAERDEARDQLPDPAAEMARLEAEKADLTDRLLRAAADMENLRRRTERDVTDARKYAVTQFAADMLAVADNLRRALEAVPAELRGSNDEGSQALIEGVEMTAREMDRLLAKHGIRRIEAKGERFDPHRHQAMFEAPDPSVPEGTIVEVVQDGYQIGDRVLRAALVGVAKGGPSADSAAGSR